jgi:hypothetical protein
MGYVEIWILGRKIAIKNAVFCDVAICSHLLRLLACRFLYPEDGSDTSVQTRPTLRHIPEDGILHSHRREKLKSYKIAIYPGKPG